MGQKRHRAERTPEQSLRTTMDQAEPTQDDGQSEAGPDQNDSR